MAVEKLTFEMNAVGNAVPEMKKVQQQLGRVDKTMKQATGSMGRYTAANRNVARAQGNLTRNLGMASLQFQDIAVQASMGTDALRIMTMQGPQLASIFGPKGMIVGALVAVGGAIALMGKGASETSFDFKKFGSDILVSLKPLQPLFDGIKYAFALLVDGLIFGANKIINGFQYLVAGIGALGAAFKAELNVMGDRFHLFNLNVEKGVRQIQKAFQQMKDLTSGSAAPGFLAPVPGDDPTTAVQDYDVLIQSLNSAIHFTGKRIDNANTGLKVMSDAMNNIKFIDINDYFTRTAATTEEVAQALKDAQKATQSIADTMKTSMEDALMGIADRTKTVEDAFRAMATDIIRQLYRVLVVQQMVGSFDAATGQGTGIVGGIMGLFGKRAMGGPVSGGRPYMVGERGPELIVPSRNAQVVPNNQLGGGGVVVNQTINVSTGVQQTVRAEIKQLMPQIADSAKAAVVDAKRRGGSYGRAFA
jgi:phage-related minor tail protein